MATTIVKIEAESEICSVCGGGGDLFTPEEHDAGAPLMQVSLRTMLLHINNFKVVPEGKLCYSCIRRAIEAYEFSSALGSRTAPPLSEKIRALRRRLRELTQKVDVFVVVGGPGGNSGGVYNEDDIISVEREALSAAGADDDDDLEKARNACGDSVFQCSVCPKSFQRASEYRAHVVSHPNSARHSCWTCGAQFARKDALREHAAEHALPGLTCHLCRVTFKTELELRGHESETSCPSRCPILGCGMKCTSRGSLSSHASAAHSHDPPLLCAQCFVQCSSRAQMASHALSHRSSERFVCGYDACILRFTNRVDLLTHIRKQHASSVTEPSSEQPPSTTCHCGRIFGSVPALKRHARVHRRDTKKVEPEWKVTVATGVTMAVGETPIEGEVEYLELEVLEEYEEN